MDSCEFVAFVVAFLTKGQRIEEECRRPLVVLGASEDARSQALGVAGAFPRLDAHRWCVSRTSFTLRKLHFLPCCLHGIVRIHSIRGCVFDEKGSGSKRSAVVRALSFWGRAKTLDPRHPTPKLCSCSSPQSTLCRWNRAFALRRSVHRVSAQAQFHRDKLGGGHARAIALFKMECHGLTVIGTCSFGPSVPTVLGHRSPSQPRDTSVRVSTTRPAAGIRNRRMRCGGEGPAFQAFGLLEFGLKPGPKGPGWQNGWPAWAGR